MALFEQLPSDESERRVYNVKSPVTLESIGQFQAASEEEVRAAVDRARKAQRDWAAKSFDERAEVMWRLVDQIVERQDDIVDLVIKETKRCATIIRRLLDFAREKAPEKKYCDLNQLIEDAAQLVEQPVRIAQIKLVLDLDDDLPEV